MDLFEWTGPVRDDGPWRGSTLGEWIARIVQNDRAWLSLILVVERPPGRSPERDQEVLDQLAELGIRFGG